MGRIFDKDGLNCIEPPATTPTPRSSPTQHHAHKEPWCLLSLNFSSTIHQWPSFRPIPTLAPSAAKVVAAMSVSGICSPFCQTETPLKIVLFSASTTLIVFVMITLILFGVLRIFDPARVSRLTQDLFSQKI